MPVNCYVQIYNARRKKILGATSGRCDSSCQSVMEQSQLRRGKQNLRISTLFFNPSKSLYLVTVFFMYAVIIASVYE